MSSDSSPDIIRTLALISPHAGGKTSLAEGLLYINGSTDKLGIVDNNSSELDADPEEKNRKMTISTHAAYYDTKGYKINIIDTPGSPLFLYQSEIALDIVDSCILVVSGIADSKEQVDRYYSLIKTRNTPSFIFMNKMDKERANFEESISSLKSSINVNPVVLTIPIGSENNLNGVVDLLNMKAIYSENSKSVKKDIPDDLIAIVNEYREKLIESIAETDDNLLETYLNGEELNLDDLKSALKKAVIQSEITPLLIGSATQLIGLHSLSEYINQLLPSPLERSVIKCLNSEGKEINIEPSEDGPVICTVFKTISDPYAGKISILRMFSGSIKSDSILYNSIKKSKVKLGQLSRILGKNLSPLSEIVPGDIFAINKIKDLYTSDTLSTEHEQYSVKLTIKPQTVLSYAIEPQTRADEDKLMPSLARISEEDPTIDYHRDEETEDFLLSGTGQIHVEIIVEKLKSFYGVNVYLKTPKVPYKETIKISTKAEGKYVKQTGGRGQYGIAWIQIDPLPSAEGYEFVNKIVGGVIPKNYIPSVEKGVHEAMKSGVYAGYPVVGVKVTLFDGKYHPVDSSDIAFQIAGSMGFKKAMENARPHLLEPIMKMVIFTPEDCLGDVIGDINSRRGKVSGMDPTTGGNDINALVPMSEILKYAPELRSITSGKGNFTIEFSHYEEMPEHLSQKIVEEKSKTDQNK